METVIAIILIVVAVVMENRKKKKAKKPAAPAAKPQTSDARQSVRQGLDKAAEAVKQLDMENVIQGAAAMMEKLDAENALEDAIAAFRKDPEDAPKGENPTPEEIPQGESVRDAEGCVGGSLGEHAEEGESRAEHAAHLKKADEARVAEARAPIPVPSCRFSAAEMRRAVVMSEILGKPKALRRNTWNPYES